MQSTVVCTWLGMMRAGPNFAMGDGEKQCTFDIFASDGSTQTCQTSWFEHDPSGPGLYIHTQVHAEALRHPSPDNPHKDHQYRRLLCRSASCLLAASNLNNACTYRTHLRIMSNAMLIYSFFQSLCVDSQSPALLMMISILFCTQHVVWHSHILVSKRQWPGDPI